VATWPTAVDDLLHAVSICVISGLLHGPPAPTASAPPRCAGHPDCSSSPSCSVQALRFQDDWKAKVKELAGRGFALASLLDFVELLLKGEVMPGFDPRRSTTNDVVRGAIIPLSRDAAPGGGGRALASVWNGGKTKLAERMVTHAWDNIFIHLVAAIVMDGLGTSTTFKTVAFQLTKPEGILELRDALEQRDSLHLSYWVCAIGINQHASICGGFGPQPRRGTPAFAAWKRKTCDFAGREHSLCDCRQQKIFNDNPIYCELNKFDDMMRFLQETVPTFKQVVAVDAEFSMFSRAWCVAELVEADSSCIPQAVLIHSSTSLEQHYGNLATLDVRGCEASRAEDKDMILKKIGNIETFNERLQWLMFATEGLFSTWVDAVSRASTVGRIAGRALRHCQSRQQRHSILGAPDAVDSDSVSE